MKVDVLSTIVDTQKIKDSTIKTIEITAFCGFFFANFMWITHVIHSLA